MVDKAQLIKDYREKYNSSLMEAARAIENCIASESVYQAPKALRDYFAAEAMNGLCAHNGTIGAYGCPGDIAERSYVIADAMLKQRQKESI